VKVEVDADELAKLRAENERLAKREQELLEKNTSLRLELQAMRSISVILRDMEKMFERGLDRAVDESKQVALAYAQARKS